ncbi:MAG: DUF6161 domain-containing protein [Maricaulis sp.]|uniref:DUF6161 domain-containing protein n=1 Tax=Maricaulis sp. TaxID=1486257 RepID=UPI0026139481|nr:DUF6161 domain-containing protein [Maricaulis sp.]MDM7983265.1 DUF6161 domain-containing protein [Maricaulis sp.]
MSFNPEQKLSRSITANATDHSVEIALATFRELFQFVDRGIQHFEGNRVLVNAGTEGQRILTMLLEPYRNIEKKRDELLANPGEKVSAAALEKLARVEIKRIEQGCSFTWNSQFNTVLERLNSNYAKLGFVAAFLGTTLDPDSDSVHNSAPNQNLRADIASGQALASLTGFAAPKIDQMDRRAMRYAAKAAKDAGIETQNLRDELRQNALDWETQRQSTAQETDQQASKLIEKHKAKLAELYEGHSERMTKIEADFKERLILEAPAQYWQNRANTATWIALGAFVGFGALVASFVCLIAWVAPAHLGHIVEAISGALEPENGSGESFSGLALVFSFALVSTPAIMALWLLMLVSRVFRENLHLANDAKHRNMLIKTYLALVEDANNPISNEDREFALNAIFSVPSEASADDAVTSVVFPKVP